MVIVLTIIFLWCVFNYILVRDMKYPPYIFSVLWFVVMFCYAFDPVYLYLPEIGLRTYIIIIGGIILFSVSGMFMVFTIRCHGYAITSTPRQEKVNRIKRFLRVSLVIISMVLFPIFFMKSVQLSRESGVDNFFIGLRLALTKQGDTGFGIIGNASIVSYFTTFLFAIESKKGWQDKALYYLTFTLSMIYGVLYTGRTNILMLLIIVILIGLCKKTLSVRHIAYFPVLFIIVFASGALIFNKGGDWTIGFYENIALITKTFFAYMLGPIAAFDNMVKLDMEFGFGENIFSWIINLWSRFFGGRFISPTKDFVYIPFPTNVYTGFRPLYVDFNMLGVFVGFLIIGMVVNYIYVKAVKGDESLYIYLYALVMFPVILNPFDDQIFAPLVSLMKYGILGLIYFRMDRYVLNNKYAGFR